MSVKVLRSHGTPGLYQSDLGTSFRKLLGQNSARWSRTNNTNIEYLAILVLESRDEAGRIGKCPPPCYQ
jgi:hypothetical protein